MKLLALVASSCLALALSWSASTQARAADWPHFRGPFYNGSTDEKGLPDDFSLTENVAWEAPLPGPSAATPVIVGDRVFVSSVNAEDETLLALAFDRKTGKKLWEHTIDGPIERDNHSNFASPSPVTDGKIVVFFYGSGDMVAYDLEGKQIWERDIAQDYGEFAFLWTFSSSPLLWKDKLYLQVLQRDVAVDGRGFDDRKNESYLLAMNPKTGKTLWRHVRPSEARLESLEAFSSPIPFTGKGGDAILIAGGDDLTAHDPADGRELWRWGTWNPRRITHWRLVPSPVASEDIVLVCAPKKAPAFAIKTDGKGKLGDDAVAWRSETRDQDAPSWGVTSDVPTPAYYDGDFFIQSDERRCLARVEPKTGEVKWVVPLPQNVGEGRGREKYESSPLAADGKIYTMNFAGQVSIFDAKDGKVIRSIPLNATREYPIRTSIAAAQGQLFIRLNRKLLCIGKKD